MVQRSLQVGWKAFEKILAMSKIACRKQVGGVLRCDGLRRFLFVEWAIDDGGEFLWGVSLCHECRPGIMGRSHGDQFILLAQSLVLFGGHDRERDGGVHELSAAMQSQVVLQGPSVGDAHDGVASLSASNLTLDNLLNANDIVVSLKSLAR